MFAVTSEVSKYIYHNFNCEMFEHNFYVKIENVLLCLKPHDYKIYIYIKKDNCVNQFWKEIDEDV